jgi:hypothetical protein
VARTEVQIECRIEVWIEVHIVFRIEAEIEIRIDIRTGVCLKKHVILHFGEQVFLFLLGVSFKMQICRCSEMHFVRILFCFDEVSDAVFGLYGGGRVCF